MSLLSNLASVLDEVRAQQLLTNPASIRGRAREVLPSVVRRAGTTATDLATALRHEPSGTDTSSPEKVARQIGRREQPPLVVGSGPDTPLLDEREAWSTEFIDLLVTHGADKAVAVAASTGSPTFCHVHGTVLRSSASRRDCMRLALKV